MIEWLRVLVGVGIALGLALTGLGRLAQWWPGLNLVNNGLPVLAAGAIALCVLAVVTRDWRSIALAGLLAAINVGLIVAGLAGAAAEAAPDAKRFLRVATFNLWFENERIDEVDTFLNQTDADVVMLQEVTHSISPRCIRGSMLAILTASAISASSSSRNARSRPTGGSTAWAIPNRSACSRGGSSSTCTAPPSKWSACIARGPSTPPPLQGQDVAALPQRVVTRTLPKGVAAT